MRWGTAREGGRCDEVIRMWGKVGEGGRRWKKVEESRSKVEEGGRRWEQGGRRWKKVTGGVGEDVRSPAMEGRVACLKLLV